MKRRQFLKTKSAVNRISLIAFVFCLIFSSQISAQLPNFNAPVIPQAAADDTTNVPVNRNTFFSIFSGNPGKAALYSLILPAGGQIYNRRWWKVPIVWGLEGGLIYWIHLNTSRLNEFQTIYIQLLNGDTSNKYGIISPDIARRERDRFLEGREFAWAYFIVAHLFSVFDAFVDRHLIEFDISEDLSLHFKVNTIPSYPQTVGVGVCIPLNKKKSPNWPVGMNR